MNSLKTTALAVCAILALAGCKKEEDPAPTPPPPPPAPTYPITGPASMSLSANGATVVYQENVAGFENVYSAFTTSPASFSSRFYNEDTETTGAQVYLRGLTYSGSVPTDEEFYDFFEPGTRSWSSLSGSSVGASVSYTTGTGFGAGENTSSLITQPATSTFTITESEPVDDGSGVTKVKVRATFNCKVISTSNASQTTITNGIFVGIFKKS